VEKGKHQLIDINRIDVSEENVRKEKAVDGLEELAESIRRLGLLQPIVVYQDGDRYKLIIGQRRFLAIKDVLNRTVISAIVLDKIDRITAIMLSLGENLERRELSYSDQIKAIETLYGEYNNVNKISEVTGLSHPTVYKYLRHRLVPREIQDLVDSGKLSQNKAYQITEVFGSDTAKAIEMANIASRVPKKTQSRAISIAKNKKKRKEQFNPDEVIQEAKKPQKEIEITIVLNADYWGALKAASKERKLDIVDMAKDAIVDWLQGKGYL